MVSAKGWRKGRTQIEAARHCVHFSLASRPPFAQSDFGLLENIRNMLRRELTFWTPNLRIGRSQRGASDQMQA